MRKLQASLLFLVLAPATLLAQSYFYTDSFSSVNTSEWNQNGTVYGTSAGLTANSLGGGSLIYKNTIPGPAGEYEVATTITLTATSCTSCGTFVTYLNASSNALAGPSPAGSFYDVELQNPTFSGGACSATLALNKYASGTFTVLASASIACNNGMAIRAIHCLGLGGLKPSPFRRRLQQARRD